MKTATSNRAHLSQLNTTATRKTIPFDYAFRFDLTGDRDATHSKTITVSVEASFTAVSIGFGVVPSNQPRRIGLLPSALANGADPNAPQQANDFVSALLPSLNAVLPQIPAVLAFGGAAAPGAAQANSRAAIRQFTQRTFTRTILAALAQQLNEPLNFAAPELAIGPQTSAALKNGLRLNPQFLERILLSLNQDELDDRTFEEAFEIVGAPVERVQFLYALFDSGSGREFQSERILSTAGLGAADGVRPFRYFARPIIFEPRSVIRMEITEVSQFAGELHISLQGFKTLGEAGSPTEVRAQLSRRRR